MNKYILIALLLLISLGGKAQQLFSGKIIAEQDSVPLVGAVIKVKETGQTILADNEGKFNLKLAVGSYTLSVHYLGYKEREISIQLSTHKYLLIALEANVNQLKEVIVSTGYQEIPKERATGSFAKVDNKLLNRNVTTNILDRLQDVVPGLVFNRVANTPGRLNISIRGQSTLTANTDPLIIIDNFPYDGDITSINPNDVESITVLRDAAAASIWGARAGNGVIVITMKKGRFNQDVQVGFTANLSLADKPDMFFERKMSTTDYINIQHRLFTEGYYKSLEATTQNQALPAAVNIWIAARDGKISMEEMVSQINRLKDQDVRRDINMYLNRESVSQQYALNVKGGGKQHQYYFSAGYDKNLASKIGNDLDRVTLNGNNTWSLLGGKLGFSTALFYSQSNINSNAPNFTPTQPYQMLADAYGKALSVNYYKDDFLNNAAQLGLLNWQNRPLDEARLADNSNNLNDFKFNAGVRFKILKGLEVNVLYQFGQTRNTGRNYYSNQTYYARDLINTFTQVGANGLLTLPIPMGGILDRNTYSNVNNTIRAQLNYAKNWAEKHDFNILAGYEVKALNAQSNGYRLYGYDNEHATSKIVDFLGSYASYSTPGSFLNIPNKDSQTDLTDHFISYYTNASYSYLNRYTFSTSLRLDQSNLFGVNTNQKGVPLYSMGLGWDISKEPFYHVIWLDYLKLRGTFGYNGNIDKTLSAYTTANYFTSSAYFANTATKQPYAVISNPPNPELRWERVKIMNLGLDFQLFNQRLNGSIEVYRKLGIDLIGPTPFPPSSGITSFKGNYAGTTSKGMDITLSSQNVRGNFSWNTDFLFSTINERVTSYAVIGSSNNYLISTGSPFIGRPLYAIYSYAWAGLDSKTGDPMGYVNGNPSKDYLAIASTTTPNNLIYNGPMRPTVFGAIRNSFAYGNFTLSVNISYRFGYYFRKPSIVYGTTYGLESGNADYGFRWQKPGDEEYTNVPSIPLTPDVRRDSFYALSSNLVEKGDHIRLQDLNLAYDLNKRKLHKLPFRSLQIYTNANNLGIIYKATKSGLDPDYYGSGKPPLSFTFGMKIEL